MHMADYTSLAHDFQWVYFGTQRVCHPKLIHRVSVPLACPATRRTDGDICKYESGVIDPIEDLGDHASRKCCSIDAMGKWAFTGVLLDSSPNGLTLRETPPPAG